MASKSYQAVETAVAWTDAVTGGDKLMDLGGLTTGAAVMGASLDLTAAPRADLYECRVIIDGLSGTPTIGQVLEVWFSESDSVDAGFDGAPTTDPDATTEGVITSAQAENCTFGGVARVTSTTAADVLQAKFVVRLTSQFVAPVVVNRTDDALNATTESHYVTLTPIPQESQ